ncbi:hypothetical protein LXL04_036650 [Taraxacum kok-saghyz]
MRFKRRYQRHLKIKVHDYCQSAMKFEKMEGVQSAKSNYSGAGLSFSNYVDALIVLVGVPECMELYLSFIC